MKTYFIEIVYNNFMPGTRYLRAIVTAKNVETAKEKVLDHFRPHYTAGDKGRFYVQCAWAVRIPTREIIEKHWKYASAAEGSIPDQYGSITVYRKFQLDKTKKEVLETWDYCNCGWASPAVYYEPKRGGYVVRLHNYMATPSPFIFFKGNTFEVFQKAKQFVKDNTFNGDYYAPFEH